MQCSNCGKKNSVVINHKRYCADCGNPLAKHIKKPSSRKTSGVLDLSNHQAKLKARPKAAHGLGFAKKSGRAQSVHGNRRAQPPRHVPTRVVDAAHVLRSQKIRKFAPSNTKKLVPKPTLVPMAAHRSYAVAPQHKQVAKYMREQQEVSYVRPVAHTTATPKAKPKRWHRLAQPFKQRRRTSLILAGGLSVLLLAAYITYLNLPNIQFRVAANRAGIDAQVPRYTPAGYDFGGAVAYSPGRLTIRFNSNSDDNYLDIAQQKTDWDSQSLLENYVLPKTEQYSTFRENGLTIYLFSTNHAAWVNSGIFYSINGHTKLNPEQILKIASSL